MESRGMHGLVSNKKNDGHKLYNSYNRSMTIFLIFCNFSNILHVVHDNAESIKCDDKWFLF